MFGLCDCNNFFVSCERVFRPDLQGVPVIVLSSNDGCIIARSNEAKALGIKMGEPFYQAKEIIERNNVVYFSGNMQLYGDMSQRVMNTLRSLVPAIEVYSIDEAFLDLSGLDLSTLQERGREMAHIIKRNTGIPVSIGIAPTKTLAKIASKLCKSYPKLNGCCLMYRAEDIDKVLKEFPIEDVWGIGRRYTKMLQSEGIFTAYQFRQLSTDWIRNKMNIMGVRTWQELKGIPAIEIEYNVPDKQSICVSRSFSKEIYSLKELNAILLTFVGMAAEKLRNQKSCAGQIMVFIHTNRHREDMPQNFGNQPVILSMPTDSTIEFVKATSAALKYIFKEGFGYKRAGIILQNIVPKNGIQGVLFDSIDRPKHDRLMHTIDTLNTHLGRDTIVLAAQNIIASHNNKEYLSPHYTTDWNEILTINV